MCRWFKGLFFLIFIISTSIKPLVAQLDSTNIPLLVIDTKGLAIEDEPKINAQLKIIYEPGTYHLPTDSGNIYSGKIGIEIRGRYSASLPQKPYGFETRDAQGENLNVSLFHMPAENDWILLPNFNDKTFMRNSLTFQLFRKMGHYAPRTQFCEVVVNNRYQGIYVLTEKIKRDKNRVNINRLRPKENSGDDLTGGYIFKIDYYNEFDSWQSTFPPLGHPDKTVHFVYEYPKVDEITPDQKAYLRQHIKDFESLLYSSDYSINKIKAYIDIPSFIDYFIINEVARNVDAYKKSSYFHKDKDSDGGLIHMGPVWDFDWAWKNINECFYGAQDGSGWAYKVHDCNIWPVPPSWMPKLMRDPTFARRVHDRYFELRDSYLSNEYIYAYIDSVALEVNEAQVRHYSKWRILGINVGAPETDQQPDTYEGEIDKFKTWISTRLSWLDKQLANFVITNLPEDLPSAAFNIYPNPAGESIQIASPLGIRQVDFYTLNGTCILHMDMNNEQKVEVKISDVPAGLYIINVHLGNGHSHLRKVLKQ